MIFLRFQLHLLHILHLPGQRLAGLRRRQVLMKSLPVPERLNLKEKRPLLQKRAHLDLLCAILNPRIAEYR